MSVNKSFRYEEPNLPPAKKVWYTQYSKLWSKT